MPSREATPGAPSLRAPDSWPPEFSPGDEQDIPGPHVHRWWMLIRRPGLDMSCATADFYVVSASVHGRLLLSGTVAVWGFGDVS